MYKATYYKADGKKGRARELPESLFDGVVNEAVLHQVVKAYRANQRQGTASAKTRSEVSGGNRKPWRQKGTGRARQGSTRAVQWEGGGRAFPPIPHSWRQSVNKKVKALARRSAFNARAEAERVVIIDALSLEKPRTAELRNFLKSLDLVGAKVLILTDGAREAVHLSARNMKNVGVRAFGEEAVYDILWADMVLIEREALDRVPAGEAEAEEEAGETTAEASEAAPPVKKKTSRKKAAAETPAQAPEEDDNA